MLAYLASAIAIILWGMYPVLAKILLADIDPIPFLFLRFLASSLFLIWVLPSIWKKLPLISWRLWIKFILSIVALIYVLIFALNLLSVGYYIVLFSFAPVLTFLFLRYQFTWLLIIGVILSIFGVMLFLFEGTANLQHFHLMPFLLLFIGMLGWVAYSVYIKDIHAVFNDLQITAITNYIALVPSLFIVGFFKPTLQHINAQIILESTLISLTLVIAFFLFSYGMRKQPVFAIFIQYIDPIVGLLSSALILGQILTVSQYFSALLIILGTVIMTIATQRQNLARSYDSKN